MISIETCMAIYHAHREIEAGEKLLADMKKQREISGRDKNAPTMKDAFGRERHLQLGVPSGDRSLNLFDVSPSLAESVIRAHIERKRGELVEANERARIELVEAPAAI